MAPRASVVVVSVRGGPQLERCLTALGRQHLAGGFEVVVVDNGSADGGVEQVVRRHREVRLVTAGRNLGFAGGYNLGLRAAGGDHLVLLNDDAEARPGWLEALVQAADSEPRAGAISSLVLFQEPAGLVDSAGLDLLDDGAVVGRWTLEPAPAEHPAREEVFAACGNGMLLRRSALEEVGAFDETFFAYFEDADLCWRMRLAGWSCWCEPAALVLHLNAATSGLWSDFYHFHVRRNRLLTVLKNAPLDLVGVAFADVGGLLVRSLGRAAVRRLAPGRASPDWPTRTGTRTQLRVLASCLRHLPSMAGRRWAIRRGRVVSDAAIRAWMRPAAAVYARPHRLAEAGTVRLSS